MLAGNVCFLPRGCSVLLTVHGPQLPFTRVEHPGTGAEDNFRNWFSDQGLLVLSLTPAWSLVSQRTLSLCQFQNFRDCKERMEYES